MKRSVIALLTLAALISCDKDDESKPACSIPATVRDLTGLDGCGFVFELEDGTRLEPIINRYYGWCGTPPSTVKEAPEDPLSNFEFVDGKRVKIEYEIQEGPSVCMVGPLARITCITEAGFEQPEPMQ